MKVFDLTQRIGIGNMGVFEIYVSFVYHQRTKLKPLMIYLAILV